MRERTYHCYGFLMAAGLQIYKEQLVSSYRMLKKCLSSFNGDSVRDNILIFIRIIGVDWQNWNIF